jgi:hypothetical protein
MHSVRAVRDTPVAGHSVIGIDTTSEVAYRTPIAVSLFLLALSFSKLKQTLWHCGELLPYVRIGSLDSRLHWDCNVMGDAVNISPLDPSNCTYNEMLTILITHILCSCQIYVAI